MSATSGLRPRLDPATGQLLAYVVRYRGRLTVGLSSVVFTTAVTLAAPWVLKLAVDDLWAGVTKEKLIYYASLLLGIAIVGGVLRFVVRWLVIGVSRGIEYDIRNDFFTKLQQMPLAYFHANRTGDLMSRATNDLSAVRMMVGPAVLYATTTGLTFIVALLFMLALNVRLTLYALIPLPFITVTARYFGRAIHTRFEKIQEQLSHISAVTQEALAGVRVVRAYGQEDRELERFRAANVEYVDRNRALIRLQGLFYPSMGLFMGLAELIVLWLGAREVIGGRMTVGELVAFNTYLAMLAWPMIAFGWVTNLLQRGKASWERMLTVLNAETWIDDRAVKYPELRPEDVRGDIEFRDLTFAFSRTVGTGVALQREVRDIGDGGRESGDGGRIGGDGGRGSGDGGSGDGGREGGGPATDSESASPVLRQISLKISAGHTVAIVGRTGSGKSTLLSLLARLHEPPPGTVFIDDKDVGELPLATLRGAIGFVPQEPFLFSATVAENIGFAGASSASGASGALGLASRPTAASARSRRNSPRPLWPAEADDSGASGASSAAGASSASGALDESGRRRIVEAAEISRLAQDVADFPDRYETRVGERGITLSGGQKQRTAIARALFIDPRILILDDAMSAVDTHTEHEILQGLREFRRGRTTLIVSHRVSTVRDADHIVVLDDARITEQGTHDQLVAQGGFYAQLHRQQLLEEELAAS